jgi:hypothetical protein
MRGEEMPPEMDSKKSDLLSAPQEVSSPSIDESPISRKEHKASMDALQESMMEKFHLMLVEHLNKPSGSITPNPANNAIVTTPVVTDASKEAPVPWSIAMPILGEQRVQATMLTRHHQATIRPTFTP